MSALKNKIGELIEPGALSAQLSVLTAKSSGDGSSAAIRAEVLKLLKQASGEGRAKIEQLLIDQHGGTVCARRLSALQDEIIKVIYDFALAHVFRINNPSMAERMAIVAVGGYGRGTLAPGSDLDLLFLLPYKQTPWGESVVEYILYMLWDMGFKVGHATRNIDQCIRLSLEDMTIRTAVLEARNICGSNGLYEDMLERFDREVVSTTAKEFIADKLAEQDARHIKSGSSRYRVEPNVKDGKGGQRDLHTMYWISKYFYRVRTQKELVKLGVFTREEHNRFSKAQNFLWSTRCHMHFLTGRAEEHLSFDIQRDIAERLGYTDRPGQSAVERFMKHYFLHAKHVGDLTRIFCSGLEEKQAKIAPGLTRIFRSIGNRHKKIRGTKDFFSHNNRINVVSNEVFAIDPVNILRMFRLAQQNGLKFHPDAMRLLTRSLKLITAKMRKDKEANRLFVEILTAHENPEAILRKMNEAEVLGRFIPEFGKIVAMMQFNMYHHYTVDEHLLRSIGILSEIEKGGLKDEHPLSHELIGEIKDRTVLYAALLLHDIAKGQPEDHSIAGAKIAGKLCPRLGLSKSQTELVSWLVEQHLIMSNTAQSRDLNDHKTIVDFADIMQSMERMKMLLILTVCDTRAVGPGVWNGWKGQLLRTIYHEAEPHLTGGFSRSSRQQRVDETRQSLEVAMVDWDEKERDHVIGLHYEAYLLSVSHEDQIRHMHFIRDADRQEKALATMVTTKQFEAITEITVLAPDHPRLLSIIAGVCAASGANIVDAQIFTTSDGRALDTIYINREFDNAEDEFRRAKRIGKLIEDVLSGTARLPDLIAARAKPKKRMSAFAVSPLFTLDNSLSNKFTVIEVECLDRPGLLSQLTNAIADLNLDIASAHIVTFGEKAIDTFYVTDLVGAKIESRQRQKVVKEKILSVIAPDNRKRAKPSRKSRKEPA